MTADTVHTHLQPHLNCICVKVVWKKQIFTFYCHSKSPQKGFTLNSVCSVFNQWETCFLINLTKRWFHRHVRMCARLWQSYHLYALRLWGNLPWLWPAAAGWSARSAPCHSCGDINKQTMSTQSKMFKRTKRQERNNR